MRYEFRIPAISGIVGFWGCHLELIRLVVRQKRAAFGTEGASASSKFRRKVTLNTKGSFPAMAASRYRHVFSPVFVLVFKLSATFDPESVRWQT